MKRVLILSLAAAVLGAGSASAETAGPSRARLRHFICQTALDPAGRAVSVTAVMRPINGTVRMALRFELLSRVKGTSALRALTGGDLNTWRSPSDPTLGRRSGDVWIINKPVANLTAPAVYRFRVLFRWMGAHNRVLAMTERDTQRCFQPELRPDLTVQSTAVSPDPHQSQLSVYVARIRNAGATAAGPFEVLYSPGDGGPTKSHLIGGLAAHSSTLVQFVSSPCSASLTPTITADPTQEVDDFNRANNSKVVVCPAATARALKRPRRGR